jgi:hypothetical protein
MLGNAYVQLNGMEQMSLPPEWQQLAQENCFFAGDYRRAADQEPKPSLAAAGAWKQADSGSQDPQGLRGYAVV